MDTDRLSGSAAASAAEAMGPPPETPILVGPATYLDIYPYRPGGGVLSAATQQVVEARSRPGHPSDWAATIDTVEVSIVG